MRIQSSIQLTPVFDAKTEEVAETIGAEFIVLNLQCLHPKDIGKNYPRLVITADMIQESYALTFVVHHQIHQLGAKKNWQCSHLPAPHAHLCFPAPSLSARQQQRKGQGPARRRGVQLRGQQPWRGRPSAFALRERSRRRHLWALSAVVSAIAADAATPVGSVRAIPEGPR